MGILRPFIQGEVCKSSPNVIAVTESVAENADVCTVIVIKSIEHEQKNVI